MSSHLLSLSRRIRKTPFSQNVSLAGAKAYTVYNHMLLPTVFKSLEEDYYHLKSAVQVWDVSVERQIEICGPDAIELLKKITPRDISKLTTNKCFYIPLVNDNGGMLNDPVVLMLDTDRYWVSIADSDVLYWMAGLASALKLNVTIREADVYPLAVQGPYAKVLMKRIFGDKINELPFFGVSRFNFGKTNFLISRSGYSKQLGFEIYVEGYTTAPLIWDALFQAGEDLDVRAGCPNLIERIEGGLLSYGNDMTILNTPYECGLEKFCNLNVVKNCIGYNALEIEIIQGTKQIIRYIEIEGKPVSNCIDPWQLSIGDKHVGQITSAAFSPGLNANIAIGMVFTPYCKQGNEVTVNINSEKRYATIYEKPFS
jgi:dimethylsulfoniopropionate demethylase